MGSPKRLQKGGRKGPPHEPHHFESLLQISRRRIDACEQRGSPTVPLHKTIEQLALVHSEDGFQAPRAEALDALCATYAVLGRHEVAIALY